MIKSMTGFGRGFIEQNGRSFTVEIKTVNHRYCDVNIKMPKSLFSFEERIRKIIKSKLNRGKIDVFITQNNYDKKDVVAHLNETLADSYYDCLCKIKERYNIDEQVSLELVSKFPDVITLKQKEEDTDSLWEDLYIPLSAAVDAVLKMRTVEGEKLKEDIIGKTVSIKNKLSSVTQKADTVVKEYEKKLRERLAELLKDYDLDENRIAMEVVIYADKASIDEEIVRLSSHLIQLEETFKLDEAVGRKLDFIVQEMNREANTIASKASDLDMINLTINIKNEIEKIREQIQNVE